jgi:hypothetical protein
MPHLDSTVSVVVISQLIVSIIGFVFVIRGLQGATEDRLYAHYNEVCKLLMTKPHLYPYFYANKVVDIKTATPLLLEEVDIMSESILGVIEHAALQRKNMPKYAWSECWKKFALERINKSEQIKDFYDKNNDWYTKDIKRVFEDAERLRTSKAVAGC